MNAHWLDIVVLIIYFGSMAMMGPLFARRSKTTEGYFVGDRSFPGWLIGVSMFATSISSITFVAYPADSYKTAWLRMVPNFMLPIGILMASHLFLPFFRRGQITSAYQYLEGRFGPKVRLYAAATYILGQIVRNSMILYLVSQLVAGFTGLSPIYSVLIGGVITSFYTVTGGIHAVVWTDFIQALVLWVGGILCVLIIAVALGGPIEGLGNIVSTAWNDAKLSFADIPSENIAELESIEYGAIQEAAAQAAPGEGAIQKTGVSPEGLLEQAPWGVSLWKKTVLMMLLIGLGNWLTEYSSNQNVIQRYVASKTPRDARIAMWVCCWFSLPTWALFMFLGTSLYVFYNYYSPQPEALAMMTGAVVEGVPAKAEGILPFFVMNQLPNGVSGLVMAAVLAAAMSSISAGINGVSAVSIVDVYSRWLKPGRSDNHYVVVAKGIGIAHAVLMIGGAMILTTIQSKTLQDTATQLTALMAGGLLGLYLLGFLTVRGGGRAAGVGIFCAVTFSAWMAAAKLPFWPDALKLGIDTYYVGVLGNIIMFVVGYVLGSTVFKRRDDGLTNQTVWTQDGTPME